MLGADVGQVLLLAGGEEMQHVFGTLQAGLHLAPCDYFTASTNSVCSGRLSSLSRSGTAPS
jgi:hypothetical protein